MGYSKPIETNATVDLNNEWVSDSEDSNYTYFKSNSNVGNIGSYSQCKVTWSNLTSTSITFKYMSSSKMDVHYLCVGHLDGEKFTSLPEDGNDNVYLSTKDKESGTYYEFTIECDKGEHHIWFCYRKGYSSHEGEDRGFIGVPKSVLQILDIKQGAELPMEYKSGGVSAEGGKTYDINFNNVILPNGSYIVPSYEDYTKTEKIFTYEYVDLGLKSGTLWAKCNIGATSETEGGVFFQWGETSGISGNLVGKYSDENYSWASYRYCNGSDATLTKYNNNTSYGENPDNITTLETTDDAVRANMGGDWRMPTKDEFDELLSGTTNEWIADYDGTGVSGRKFTSKTDTSKYIFFPMVHYCLNGSVDSNDVSGVWSSSLYTSRPYDAQELGIGSYGCYMVHRYRYYGLSVRGVRK